MSDIDAMNVEAFAGILYDHYCEKVGGVAFNGDPLPKWEEFRADPKKLKQSEAWVSTAITAMDTISAYVRA